MSEGRPLSGLRIAKLCYHPHPVHKALLESVGAQMVGGWLLAWAKGSLWQRRAYSRLSALLAPLDALRLRGRFDCVVVPPYSLALGYWVKRWSPRTRLILMNGDSFFWGYQKMSHLGRRYFDVYLRSLDGILSNSRLVDALARQVCGAPTRVFRPFLDSSFFAEINPNAADVAIVGWFEAHKAFPDAVDVHAQAGQQTALGKLTIIGDGPQRAAIAERARTVPGVEMLGALDRTGIQRCLSRTLILLHLADNEAWGVVVWEAAAAGVIPVVTDQVGAAEYLPQWLVVSAANRRAEAAAVVQRIVAMDADERVALRRQLQTIAGQFVREPCIAAFRQSFTELWAEIEQREKRESLH
jgi:glycosyltransferase involved in cell wall biosynthesis